MAGRKSNSRPQARGEYLGLPVLPDPRRTNEVLESDPSKSDVAVPGSGENVQQSASQTDADGNVGDSSDRREASAAADPPDSLRGAASDSHSNATTIAAPAVPQNECALIGHTIGDRYRVVELLGRGGMGAVYRADHIHIKKSFAFKVLHPELTHHSEAVKRFEREAIAAARIDHPNVATAIDFGNLPTGEFYLVLNYVQGHSLRELLDREHALSEARTVRIARQIASALAAAHGANIVHRDLKPDNVMLVDGSNEPDFVKVLDFGIAKIRSDELSDEPAITRFGTVFGTPEYMSPEQALGQTVDARSNLYSLGIMMYEMLAGVTPFADEQLVTVLSRHMTETPAALDRIAPELWAIIERLLAKRPEGRPNSAEDVIQAIDALPLTLLGVALGRGSRGSLASGSFSALETTDTILAVDGTTIGSSILGRELMRSQGALGAQPFSLPPWLKQQVTVAGKPLPWVLIAFASGLVLATVALTLALGSVFSESDDTATTTNSAQADRAAIRSEQERRIAEWSRLAALGDVEALKALEARPEPARAASEWAAIGAGRMHAKRYVDATTAYERALTLDARTTATPQTVSDLYDAAQQPESSEAALAIALKYLGSRGADLVYAIYDGVLAAKLPKLDRKKLRAMLESKELEQQASDALKAQLSLDSAKSCQEYRALLPQIKTHGDTRALKQLRKLTYARGCGLLGLGDCYGCLRSSRALADALEAAKSRPAPTF
ncbi:MAG: serine/threonine-protein kinase [Polyangiaceae bacterium]